jgi:crotonobetainyl-CoA:carnitine CoA-transferase CaiB-like acyl-CoA transferase
MTWIKDETASPAAADQPSKGPLTGVRVLDISHQYAGALAGSMLADLGADVLAVEHPDGNSVRTMLPHKQGTSLWWKVAGRGKRDITLKLSSPEGREVFLDLARQADVLIENFRPGTLEKWGLGPKDLESAGVGLVMLRISGFGQTGAYRTRPGFGSVAEAMSGFAHLTGMPDGPPIMPSTTLADGVTGTFGCLGLIAALYGRERGQSTSTVDVVDACLVESMFRIIPTQVIGYDQLDIIPMRPGNNIGSHGVLRNLYQSSDGVYFTASAVGPATIERVLRVVAADDLRLELAELPHREREGVEKFFADADARVVAWAATLTYAEVEQALVAEGVVHAKVYDIADIYADPYFVDRDNIIEVPDAELGMVKMQGIAPKLTGYSQRVTHAGPRRGIDNEEVYTSVLGMSPERLAELHSAGIT